VKLALLVLPVAPVLRVKPVQLAIRGILEKQDLRVTLVQLDQPAIQGIPEKLVPLEKLGKLEKLDRRAQLVRLVKRVPPEKPAILELLDTLEKPVI
jgi:hypothetical protein